MLERVGGGCRLPAGFLQALCVWRLAAALPCAVRYLSTVCRWETYNVGHDASRDRGVYLIVRRSKVGFRSRNAARAGEGEGRVDANVVMTAE